MPSVRAPESSNNRCASLPLAHPSQKSPDILVRLPAEERSQQPAKGACAMSVASPLRLLLHKPLVPIAEMSPPAMRVGDFRKKSDACQTTEKALCSSMTISNFTFPSRRTSKSSEFQSCKHLKYAVVMWKLSAVHQGEHSLVDMLALAFGLARNADLWC